MFSFCCCDSPQHLLDCNVETLFRPSSKFSFFALLLRNLFCFAFYYLFIFVSVRKVCFEHWPTIGTDAFQRRTDGMFADFLFALWGRNWNNDLEMCLHEKKQNRKTCKWKQTNERSSELESFEYRARVTYQIYACIFIKSCSSVCSAEYCKCLNRFNFNLFLRTDSFQFQ